MEKKIFNKGDFIKYSAYSSTNDGTKFAFGIFEGVDLAPEFQYTKKLSLAAFYDSWKYCSNLDNGVGWGYQPVLEIASQNKPCEKTIDTICEDSWWTVCTPLEKKRALEILAKYDVDWNEEEMTLTNVKTGEILHRIIIPKLEYNGDVIKPICHELKTKLKTAVLSKNKTSCSSSYPSQYNPYGYNGYDEYYD
jgi:hypothetical protein